MTLTDGLDSASLRTTFGLCPSGVVAVCARDHSGARIGMVVSTFVPVSIDPPLVAICVQRSSTTWPHLGSRRNIGLSVLASSHAAAARRLSSRHGDRFEGTQTETSKLGAIFIEGALAHFDTSVHRTVDAGDHWVVLLTVHAVSSVDMEDPIIFHRSSFHEIASVAP
nr:flavin reductase family protein [Rhodococcus sp. (in: high G+C Gram-positive bacteria)]